MSKANTLTRTTNWKALWSSSIARFEVIGGSALLAVCLGAMPSFFSTIEKRKGVRMDDFVLDMIPAHNVSLIIFAFIWGMAALVIYRAVKQPSIYITCVWAYSFIILIRFATISLIKLDPPAGLIQLADPLTGIFYGNNNITKDLFFSGHTSTLFLIFLVLEKRTDKIIGLISVTCVGFLLLVQHVHYTLDVVVAPFAVFGVYKLVKAMLGDYTKYREVAE